MNILESTNIDLIEPFPPSQIKRLRGWMYCYKTLVVSDADAQTPEEFLEVIESRLHLPQVRSWGVIDKLNQINHKHEAPLIGFLAAERVSPYNLYMHVASSRSCWGKGFIDEAARALFSHLFTTEPDLLRLSASIIAKNSPAKALAHRLGFEREGLMKHLILQEGEPQDVVHYGLTRTRWQELCLSSQQPSLS